jgi:hypothetical protein
MFAHAKNPASGTGGFFDAASLADAIVCQKMVKFRRRKLLATQSGNPDAPACIIEQPCLRNGDIGDDPMRHYALIIPGCVDREDITTPGRRRKLSFFKATVREHRHQCQPPSSVTRSMMGVWDHMVN